MGAEFLLSYIPYPVLTDDRRATIEATIDALTFENINEYADNAGVDDYDTNEEVVAEVQQRLRRVFSVYADMEHYRTTTTLHLCKRRYLFAGGMSPGDSPTEEFDDLWMLYLVDKIYRQLEAWMLEDAQEV
ncbi:MAG: hypothetical protein PHR28_09215 [candidate division Zixibacteria bacterium]|jgi:hypothetical protein|nr:hypothetical protein [candidate division Zixibacteria bacterium]